MSSGSPNFRKAIDLEDKAAVALGRYHYRQSQEPRRADSISAEGGMPADSGAMDLEELEARVLPSTASAPEETLKGSASESAHAPPATERQISETVHPASAQDPSLVRLSSCTLCGLMVGFRRVRYLCLHCRCELCEYCVINEGGVGPWCGECPLPLNVELPPSPNTRLEQARAPSSVNLGDSVALTSGNNSRQASLVSAPGSPRNTGQRLNEGTHKCYICGAKYGLLTWKRQCDDCQRYTCDSCNRKVKGQLDSTPTVGKSTKVSTSRLCLACFKMRSNARNAAVEAASPLYSDPVAMGSSPEQQRAMLGVSRENSVDQRSLAQTTSSPSPARPDTTSAAPPVSGQYPATHSESQQHLSSPSPAAVRAADSVGPPPAPQAMNPQQRTPSPQATTEIFTAVPLPPASTSDPAFSSGSSSSRRLTAWEERMQGRTPQSRRHSTFEATQLYEGNGSFDGGASWGHLPLPDYSNAASAPMFREVSPQQAMLAPGAGAGQVVMARPIPNQPPPQNRQQQHLDTAEADEGEGDEAFARRLALMMEAEGGGR